MSKMDNLFSFFTAKMNSRFMKVRPYPIPPQERSHDTTTGKPRTYHSLAQPPGMKFSIASQFTNHGRMATLYYK